MKFIRRANQDLFIEDQSDSIGPGGGTVTITDVPITPDTAIEVELDDGTTVVLLGYLRK